MNFSELRWRLSQLNKKRKYRKRLAEAEKRINAFVGLGKNAIGVVAATRYGYFVTNVEDDCVGKGILNGGGFPDAEISFLKRILTKDSSVLIVGAHIGTLAIPLHSHVSRIVAIEANPHTYEYLALNVSINNVPNIQIANFAAAEDKKKISFLLSRVNSGGSKRAPSKGNIGYYFDNPDVVEVQARRLDDEYANEKFNLVLMDIEGSEFFAIKGGKETLKKADFFCVEFLPHHLRDVANISVSEFLRPIHEIFDFLYVPKSGGSYKKDRFYEILEGFFASNQNHDLLIFSKAEIAPNAEEV